MNETRVVIRADASSTIGSGHVMRCLAIADELRTAGAKVEFVSRSAPGDLIPRIEERGYAVHRLDQTDPVDEERDADETRGALADGSPPWVIVDHYALGSDWEASLRPGVSGMIAIDDLERVHDCDVLLDQTWLGAATETRYESSIPGAARRLLGPRFALLNPDFAALRRVVASRHHPPRRVLISFGGADATNETQTVLLALMEAPFDVWHADVVLGPQHPDPESVRAIAARRPLTTVHEGLQSLAELMCNADCAITGGGVTLMERLCLDLPGVVVTTAANQQPSVSALAAAGYIDCIGSAGTLSVQDYRAALAQPPVELANLPPLVDGCGAGRLREVLFPADPRTGCMRPAELRDAGLLFHWRDATVQRFALVPAPLSWPSHLRWFTAKLEESATQIWIVEADRVPVGQFRLEAGVHETTLSYSVDAEFRGRGWGRWIVEAAVSRVTARKNDVIAAVHPDNRASIAIFSGLGWTRFDRDDRIVFRTSSRADRESA
jgi:UDP-2,4-diacetamido-2,4,6-trideoxy-beta-L-altropyranose hydrolase